MRDDVFDGDVEHRLRRAGRRVRAAAVDAQVRDWLAERPDRVGFSRWGQAHEEIMVAAGRYGRGLPEDWGVQLAGGVVWIVTTVAILLIGGTSLPVLAGAIAAGPLAAQVVVSGAARVGRRRAEGGPAPIDDPAFRADVSRRLEACAAADIMCALDWLSSADRDR